MRLPTVLGTRAEALVRQSLPRRGTDDYFSGHHAGESGIAAIRNRGRSPPIASSACECLSARARAFSREARSGARSPVDEGGTSCAMPKRRFRNVCGSAKKYRIGPKVSPREPHARGTGVERLVARPGWWLTAGAEAVGASRRWRCAAAGAQPPLGATASRWAPASPVGCKSPDGDTVCDGWRAAGGLETRASEARLEVQRLAGRAA
jgi:hypothetical protein